MGPISPTAGAGSLVLTLGLLTACQAPQATVSAPAAEVIEVVDGDTLVVRSSGRTETIRLIGIDTPEVAHHGMPAECFGPEATDRLRALLPPGSIVTLAVGVEPRDAYDRLLAYVATPDIADVASVLAREGFARELAISPNLGTADGIAEAVTAARTEQLGLWSSCAAAAE